MPTEGTCPALTLAEGPAAAAAIPKPLPSIAKVPRSAREPVTNLHYSLLMMLTAPATEVNGFVRHAVARAVIWKNITADLGRRSADLKLNPPV
jgi:hypothetical protein